MRIKTKERFTETRKRKGQDESDTGDNKESKRSSSKVIGFFQEKLEQDHKFRWEDLQDEKIEREARERQHNQFWIQNQQMQTQQSQDIQAFVKQQDQILALLLQRQ